MKYLRLFIERCKEPSSWAGLMGLFLLLGFTQARANEIFLAAAGVCMFLSFFLAENKRRKK